MPRISVHMKVCVRIAARISPRIDTRIKPASPAVGPQVTTIKSARTIRIGRIKRAASRRRQPVSSSCRWRKPVARRPRIAHHSRRRVGQLALRIRVARQQVRSRNAQHTGNRLRRDRRHHRSPMLIAIDCIGGQLHPRHTIAHALGQLPRGEVSMFPSVLQRLATELSDLSSIKHTTTILQCPAGNPSALSEYSTIQKPNVNQTTKKDQNIHRKLIAV